jgi:hypothetical protein
LIGKHTITPQPFRRERNCSQPPAPVGPLPVMASSIRLSREHESVFLWNDPQARRQVKNGAFRRGKIRISTPLRYFHNHR